MMRRSARVMDAYAEAFECAPIGQAVLTVAGRFLAANAALHTLLDHPAGALLDLCISDVLEPADADVFSATVGRLVAAPAQQRGRPRPVQQRYRTGSGTAVVTAQSISLVGGQDGGEPQVLLQLEDLTTAEELERQLARERDRVREAQLIGRLGSWEVDTASGLVTWSDALFELRGIDKATFGGDFAAATALVHPQDRQRVRSAIEDATRTGQQTMIRYRACRADDQSERWFDARFKGLYQHGQLVTLAGTVVDVTEDVLAEEKIRSAYAFQQAIIAASPDITFLYDLATALTVWSSRSVREALGYPAGIESADALTTLVPEPDQAAVQAALRAAGGADDDDVVSVSFRMLDAAGSLRWFSCRTIALDRADDGTVAQLVGVLRDITEAKAVEQRLQHLALHDDLTGLANRALLIDRIQGSLLRSARDGREVSVLFCDLDGFKRVNDTAGHAAGDAVLIETARRLENVLREGDTVARVGGDEFVLVVEPWNRPEMPSGPPPGGQLASDRELGPQIAERVAAAVRRPIEYNGVEHVISASIGVTYGPMVLPKIPTAVTADALLQDADAAMYTAKQRGKDRFEVFEHGMRTDVVERGRVERVLRRALRTGRSWSHDPARPAARVQPDRVWAVYQPIFSADSGALAGFEALARLADGTGTSIAPDTFIPIAEETGLIRALGVFMLDQAVGQLSSWRSRWREFADITMAVNVSALQVGHASLAQDVRQALATHGLAPQDLVLELTETSLLQAGRSSITALAELRADGMGVDIDDFGVGYASLRYLATMPVSGVKIDRSFTARLPDDTVSRKIVRAIAALAADLELVCTVEGVETAAQQGALPDGVRLQGWYTGRPLDAADVDLPALDRSVSGHSGGRSDDGDQQRRSEPSSADARP